jgi:hypothetical protein
MEMCQVVDDNGGTYFLYLSSWRDYDLSECAAGTPLQGDSIGEVLNGDPKYGPHFDRRCVYDSGTDPSVDALVGVYSSSRESDRAAAREICELHHGTNPH